MVQVIQPRNLGGEVGEAISGSFTQAFDKNFQQKQQSSLLGQGLDKVEAEIAEAQAGDTPMDITTLTKIYARNIGGIDGGDKLMGSLIPMHYNKIQWDAKNKTQQPGGQTGSVQGNQGIAQESRAETQEVGADPQSVDQEIAQLAEYYGRTYNMSIPDANARATQEIAAKNSLRETREKERSAFFTKNVAENFANDIDPAVLSYFKNKYDSLSNNMSQSEAWKTIEADVRKTQKEIVNLKADGGRNMFYSSEENTDRARNMLKDTIKAAPEIAREKAREIFGLGPREASEVIRPGSKEYQSFKKAVPKIAADIKYSLISGTPEKFQQSKDRAEKAVRQYLKGSFDTNKDSLIAVKALAQELEIDHRAFTRIVDDVFPDKRELSPYNERELSELPVSEWPTLAEVFSDWSTALSLPGKAIKRLKGAR